MDVKEAFHYVFLFCFSITIVFFLTEGLQTYLTSFGLGVALSGSLAATTAFLLLAGFTYFFVTR